MCLFGNLSLCHRLHPFDTVFISLSNSMLQKSTNITCMVPMVCSQIVIVHKYYSSSVGLCLYERRGGEVRCEVVVFCGDVLS
jgi:hypothetical protein